MKIKFKIDPLWIYFYFEKFVKLKTICYQKVYKLL